MKDRISSPGSYSRLTALLLCAVTFVCAWIFYSHTFPIGDDLVYWDWYRDIRSRHGDLTGWPIFAYSNWEGANGRLANMVTPLFLWFSPAWLKGLLDAVVLTLLLWFGLRLTALSGNKPMEAPAVSLYALLTAATFPWWDSMAITDCVLNYPLSDMLALGCLILWFRHPARHSEVYSWWAALLGLVAGAMHEASGVALCGAFIISLILDSDSRRDTVRRYLTVGTTLGTLVTLSSPAIWIRFVDGAVSEPDAPLWKIILVSDYYLIILLVVLGVMACRGSLIRYLRSRPDITLLLAAALLSACFSVAGGVIGRSGWFVQSFSLIALFRMVPRDIRINTVLSMAMTAVFTACFCTLWIGSAYWQTILGKEGIEVLEEYVKAPDGIVFATPTEEEDLPVWLLRRNKGVPDADDMFPLREYAARLHPGSAPFIVLPTPFRNYVKPGFCGTVRYSDDYLTDSRPEHTVMINPTSAVPGPEECEIAGRRMTVRAIPCGEDTLYHITPRRIDPGDK
ncbi:MAG: hypothetical protein K2O24_06820 [Muribaculaceae bacterium]|nr:hypothetical protein [Muribaculaceae bacterium]